MDPNTLLIALRKRISQANALIDGPSQDREWTLRLLGELAAEAGAMDEWLASGGFLPTAWER